MGDGVWNRHGPEGNLPMWKPARTNLWPLARIKVWEKTVQMVLLWALETCRSSIAQRKALDRCQNQMAARMLRSTRKWSSGESFLEFAQRKSKFARWMIQQWSLPVSDRLLDKTFSWAGHVARMPIDRWAKRSILWRGCFWKKNGKLRCSWNAYEHDFRWKIRGVSKRAFFSLGDSDI